MGRKYKKSSNGKISALKQLHTFHEKYKFWYTEKEIFYLNIKFIEIRHTKIKSCLYNNFKHINKQIKREWTRNKLSLENNIMVNHPKILFHR